MSSQTLEDEQRQSGTKCVSHFFFLSGGITRSFRKSDSQSVHSILQKQFNRFKMHIGPIYNYLSLNRELPVRLVVASAATATAAKVGNSLRENKSKALRETNKS